MSAADIYGASNAMRFDSLVRLAQRSTERRDSALRNQAILIPDPGARDVAAQRVHEQWAREQTRIDRALAALVVPAARRGRAVEDDTLARALGVTA